MAIPAPRKMEPALVVPIGVGPSSSTLSPEALQGQMTQLRKLLRRSVQQIRKAPGNGSSGLRMVPYYLIDADEVARILGGSP